VADPVSLPPVTVSTLPIATVRTGTTLVLGSGSNVFVVDIDAGTTEARLDVPPGFVVGRGWMVRRRGAHALLERGDETPRRLGPASYLAPAADGDSAWLVEATRDPARAREIDARRGTSGPPVALPPQRTLVGAVTSGLVLVHEGPGAVEVYDPTAARIRLTLGATRTWPVARGDLVAWIACGPGGRCDLHLTDAASGADRAVPLGGPVAALAIAPDGRTVAVAVQPFDRNLGDIELIDVATGQVRPLRGAWFGTTALAWARSSDRIFVASNLGREIWMYGTSDERSSQELRVRIPFGSPIDAIAVL
jgi:hypothetical protein